MKLFSSNISKLETYTKAVCDNLVKGNFTHKKIIIFIFDVVFIFGIVFIFKVIMMFVVLSIF